MLRIIRSQSIVAALLVGSVGCQATRPVETRVPTPGGMPRELCKTVLPTYTVEPPDILVIEAIHLVPGPGHPLRARDLVSITVRRGDGDPLKEEDVVNVQVQGVPAKIEEYALAPGDVLRVEAFGRPESYRIAEGDRLHVQAFGLPTTAPLDAAFVVQPDGQIRLRATEYETITNEAGAAVGMQPVRVQDYGLVPVGGLTAEQAEQAILERLEERFKGVAVVARLEEPAPVEGVFQVQSDGKIWLRIPEYGPVRGEPGAELSRQPVQLRDFGEVAVGGMSVKQAEAEIGKMLAERFTRVAVMADLARGPVAADGAYLVDRSGDVILPLPYGRVPVRGKNIVEAEQAIRERIEQFAYQVTAQVTLATDTPVRGMFLVESDGRIDLNNPVRAPRVGGENVGAVLHFSEGPIERAPEPPLGPQQAPGGAEAYPMRSAAVGPKMFYRPVPNVAGLTLEQATEAIRRHLTEFDDIEVWMTLEQPAAQQMIAGEHLVGPDGTVTLGTYGSVSLVGMTLAQAKMAVEHHLSHFFTAPEVSVDVFAYNSKKYYVVTQGAGLGDGVYTFPVTGNDTVLDAISQIQGLQAVSSKRIWVARPTPESSVARIMPVDWEAITAQGVVETNYQLLPGDRLFIAEDKLVAFDTNLGKLIAPVERVMGFTLLGAGTASRLSGPVLRGGGNRQSNF